MLKKTSIFAITALIITYVFSTNTYMLDNLPWDFKAPFKHNIAPYLVVFLAFISPYLAVNTLWNLKEATIKTDAQSIRSIGFISSIEYSGYRINNKPMFKVAVSYDGISKSFDALSEKIQFHFKIGDESVIYYNPDNGHDAFFDIDESIEHKLNDGKN